MIPIMPWSSWNSMWQWNTKTPGSTRWKSMTTLVTLGRISCTPSGALISLPAGSATVSRNTWRYGSVASNGLSTATNVSWWMWNACTSGDALNRYHSSTEFWCTRTVGTYGYFGSDGCAGARKNGRSVNDGFATTVPPIVSGPVSVTYHSGGPPGAGYCVNVMARRGTPSCSCAFANAAAMVGACIGLRTIHTRLANAPAMFGACIGLGAAAMASGARCAAVSNAGLMVRISRSGIGNPS